MYRLENCKDLPQVGGDLYPATHQNIFDQHFEPLYSNFHPPSFCCLSIQHMPSHSLCENCLCPHTCRDYYHHNFYHKQLIMIPIVL